MKFKDALAAFLSVTPPDKEAATKDTGKAVSPGKRPKVKSTRTSRKRR
jgi:hypothetical protein